MAHPPAQRSHLPTPAIFPKGVSLSSVWARRVSEPGCVFVSSDKLGSGVRVFGVLGLQADGSDVGVNVIFVQSGTTTPILRKIGQTLQTLQGFAAAASSHYSASQQCAPKSLRAHSEQPRLIFVLGQKTRASAAFGTNPHPSMTQAATETAKSRVDDSDENRVDLGVATGPMLRAGKNMEICVSDENF